MNVPIVYVVVGVDGSVRGFAYVSPKYADEGRKEADENWPKASPHVVVRYVGYEVVS